MRDRPASRRFAIAAWLAVATLAPAAAAATPANEVDRGIQLFAAGRFQEALAVFDKVCGATDLEREQRLECKKHQAFSLYVLSMPDAARAAWLELLQWEPSYTLDPNYVSPEFIAFFGRIEPPPAQPPEATRPPEMTSSALARGCGVLLCLAPFGVAQMANERPLKAAIVAGVELAALAVNIGLYTQRVRAYERLGYIEDPRAAERSLWVQRAALFVFAGALVVGAVDAFVWP